jgi:quinol monooxygenase YgiN
MRGDTMIGMMVEFTIAPGNTDAFERAFAVQVAAVRANEPGNRLYELFKSTTLADSYTLVEIYEDDAALAAHRTSAHMAANRPQTAPFLSAPFVCVLAWRSDWHPVGAASLRSPLHVSIGRHGAVCSARIAPSSSSSHRHLPNSVLASVPLLRECTDS